jgi:hypothetical protein
MDMARVLPGGTLGRHPMTHAHSALFIGYTAIYGLRALLQLGFYVLD